MCFQGCVLASEHPCSWGKVSIWMFRHWKGNHREVLLNLDLQRQLCFCHCPVVLVFIASTPGLLCCPHLSGFHTGPSLLAECPFPALLRPSPSHTSSLHSLTVLGWFLPSLVSEEENVPLPTTAALLGPAPFILYPFLLFFPPPAHKLSEIRDLFLWPSSCLGCFPAPLCASMATAFQSVPSMPGLWPDAHSWPVFRAVWSLVGGAIPGGGASSIASRRIPRFIPWACRGGLLRRAVREGSLLRLSCCPPPPPVS